MSKVDNGNALPQKSQRTPLSKLELFLTQIKKRLQHKCHNRLKFHGTPGRIRTCDPLIRSQVLYPAELLVH
jgi:hypothetical protein